MQLSLGVPAWSRRALSAGSVLPELEAPCSGGRGPAAQNHGPRGALGGQLAQDSIDSLGGSPRDQIRSQALLRQHQGRVWGNWQPAPELSELGSQVSGARKHPNLLRGQSWSRGSSPTARAPTPCPTVPPAARGQSWSSSLWKWGWPGPAAPSPPPLALQGAAAALCRAENSLRPRWGHVSNASAARGVFRARGAHAAPCAGGCTHAGLQGVPSPDEPHPPSDATGLGETRSCLGPHM